MIYNVHMELRNAGDKLEQGPSHGYYHRGQKQLTNDMTSVAAISLRHPLSHKNRGSLFEGYGSIGHLVGGKPLAQRVPLTKEYS